jgi:hypothetical protein
MRRLVSEPPAFEALRQTGVGRVGRRVTAGLRVLGASHAIDNVASLGWRRRVGQAQLTHSGR